MRHIPADQLREGLKFSESDAVFASIQATVLKRPKKDRLELWKSAYYRITSSLLMDNQESRSLGTIIKVRIELRICLNFSEFDHGIVDISRGCSCYERRA